jgi:two-component system, LuxR family, sensor histidine kinase DctS
VLALLAVLVFLTREYEDRLALDRLQQNAASMASDVRAGLVRNVQNLQAAQSEVQTPAQWGPAMARLLVTQREMVLLEWRDDAMGLLAQRSSPYHPSLFDRLPRQQVLAEVRQACALASRTSAPAYAPSYFWPSTPGQGLELMEGCLPLSLEGRPAGFLVVTYSLSSVLSELIAPEARRGRRLALSEADGTRLSVIGTLPLALDVQHAEHLLDLPGVTYMLRLERTREAGGWLPHVLTVVVGALALALLAVLALFARDLGRRQRAEQGLADALAFRKAMEDSLVTGLRARDMDGRITYVNPAFCQMVGLPADALLGTGTPAPYWPPDRLDEYQQRNAVRLSGGLVQREGFESEFVRADGTRFPVLIIEAPLIDAQRTQTGWMSAILDLSEQRRSEDLTRASQERLQATARLAMAGEMASLLSHELNQPLAAIASYATGSLNLLQEASGQPSPSWQNDLQLALQRMAEQAQRAGKVIQGVTDLVRRREGSRASVSVEQLFEGIQPLLQLHAKKAGVALVQQIAPGCPPVWCDRTMVEQVLLNLARNGMQAMPNGDPGSASGLRKLTLQACPVASTAGPNGRAGVAFSVTDHGHGLPAEVARHIYTPFFTTKAEGMGLGLNLCRTVVEQHGGALQHDAAQPQGTVFRFTLPAAV